MPETSVLVCSSTHEAVDPRGVSIHVEDGNAVLHLSQTVHLSGSFDDIKRLILHLWYETAMIDAALLTPEDFEEVAPSDLPEDHQKDIEDGGF